MTFRPICETLAGVLAVCMLSSCGTPGIPLPPSLELPKPVQDLRAARKGNKVYLSWSAPARTTDRQSIRHLGRTRVCRARDLSAVKCEMEVGSLAPAKPADRNKEKARASVTPAVEKYIDQLPAALPDGRGDYVYAVEVFNDVGRSAGLSNLVKVSSALVVSPPADFAAKLSAEGVALTWTPAPKPSGQMGVRYFYRIYRRGENGKAEIAADQISMDVAIAGNMLDSSIEWEKHYSYRATVVTEIGEPREQIEGDDTAEVSVFTHDVFPPTVPSGLQAAFAGEGQELSIDLIWNANTEKDLAGYNVFRYEQGSAVTKINSDTVKVAAFRDTNLLAGRKYYYSVSAVDVCGNESARSDETNESVP